MSITITTEYQEGYAYYWNSYKGKSYLMID